MIAKKTTGITQKTKDQKYGEGNMCGRESYKSKKTLKSGNVSFQRWDHSQATKVSHAFFKKKKFR